MKAAYVCRACHRVLQATQASPTAQHLHRATVHRFSTRPQLHGAAPAEASLTSDAQESSYRAPLPNQRNPQRPRGGNKLALRDVDSKPTSLAEYDEIFGALTLRESPTPSADNRQPRARTVELETNEPNSEGQRQTQSQEGKRLVRGTVPFKKRKNKPKTSWDARIEKKRICRYLQWGYIRHGHSDSELVEVKKAYNFWRRGFSRLQRRERPTDESWYEEGKRFYTMKDVKEMRASWESMDLEQRQEIWPRVMLSTIYRSPKAASRVLSATLDPLPPGYAISDVLLVIAKWLDSTTEGKRRARGHRAFNLLLRLLDELPAGYMPLNQRAFGIFAKNLTIDQTATLYGILKESRAMLHPYTALHFARKLAGSPTQVQHKEKAFQILLGLADNGVDLNKQEFASAITSLLHCEAPSDPSSKNGVSFSPTHALQALMEKGFVPNVFTFTAYLDALCQRREIAEVIRLAKTFSNSGLKLDAKAIATIFRGAKQSLDAASVREVLELSQKTNTPPVSVLNNALHAIFYFSEMDIRERKIPPSEGLRPFLPMLRIYAKKFDLKPLQSLIPDSLPFILMGNLNADESSPQDSQPKEWEFERTIVPVIDSFVSEPGPKSMEPDSTTLATMFRAYIKSLWRPYDLMALYSYFKSQLEDQGKDPSYAAQLVREEGSLIHDTFILAMMQQPGLTRPALEIFGDMLKSHLHPPSSTDVGASEAKPLHPMPSVFTFGILLSGLMRRRETNLAEQVTQVMKENGVEPNLATWNIQLRGHALMQNVPRTVSALQDLEASGFRPDAHTFKAFGWLRNQRQALEMMEKIIDLNKQKINEHSHEDEEGKDDVD